MFRELAEDIVFALLCKGLIEGKKRELYEKRCEKILRIGTVGVIALVIALMI